MEKTGEICYYLYDGHGNVRTLTNEAGRITDRYSYDAYGSLLEKEAIRRTSSSTQGNSIMQTQGYTT